MNIAQSRLICSRVSPERFLCSKWSAGLNKPPPTPGESSGVNDGNNCGPRHERGTAQEFQLFTNNGSITRFGVTVCFR
jgi:hypothetical protein